jgi:putative NIF3 family GTP cyclohydrolase 1 type 2
MTVNTNDIMRIGLDLVGWNRMPHDSAIHVKGNSIQKALITIDVSTSELFLAKNFGCDAVIAHHPIGASSMEFHRVFDRHVQFMVQNGVPDNAARSVVKRLKRRIQIRSHANIYKQVVDAARILKMPLVNIHQPCDEFMRRTILGKIKDYKKDHKISDLLKLVDEIPEFKKAVTRPIVVLGSTKSNVGRVALVVAAGTNGGYPIAKLYYEHGISTVIYLHIDPVDAAKLNDEKIRGNLIILGHLAGDSIGLNALADKIELEGVETVRMGIISGSKNR